MWIILMTVVIASANNPSDYQTYDAFVPNGFRWQQFESQNACEKFLVSWFASSDNDAWSQMRKNLGDDYPARLELMQTSDEILDIELKYPEHNKMFCVQVSGNAKD